MVLIKIRIYRGTAGLVVDDVIQIHLSYCFCKNIVQSSHARKACSEFSPIDHGNRSTLNISIRSSLINRFLALTDIPAESVKGILK